MVIFQRFNAGPVPLSFEPVEVSWLDHYVILSAIPMQLRSLNGFKCALSILQHIKQSILYNIKCNARFGG